MGVILNMPWQIKSTRYKCSGICLGHISTQELHPQHSAFFLSETDISALIFWNYKTQI